MTLPEPAEIATVLARILRTHIPTTEFAGFEANDGGALTIYVADHDTLIRAALDLHLRRQGTLDRWGGVVDDIDVVLNLRIPLGIIPPQRDRRGLGSAA